MTKISKNIKKLRTAQNLSQEALAEKLFISRQAVSSWENNRTQPDIEMIGKLSEIFGVSIEELIYGEKPKIHLDNEDKSPSNKVLIVVFSILGSLLIAGGVIFFIIFGWDKFNIVAKSIITFLPVIIGQGIAVFTFLKKNSSTAWKEGASILWAIGSCATIGLCNSVFDISVSSYLMLILLSVSALIPIYFFDAVSPLAAYYLLAFGAAYQGKNEILEFTVLIIQVGIGVLYTVLNKHKGDNPRHCYSIWLTIVAVFATLFTFIINVENQAVSYENTSIFVLFIAFFVSMITQSKSMSLAKPFHYLGTLGFVGTLIMLTIEEYDLLTIKDIVFFDPEIFSTDYYAPSFPTILTIFIIKILTATALITFGFISGKKTFEKNPAKLILCITGIVATLAALFTGDSFSTFAVILAAITGIVLIVSGSGNNKFFDLNIGLITLMILIFELIYKLDLDFLALGILFMVSGAILLGVNFTLVKKAKRDKLKIAQENDASSTFDGGESDV